MFTEYCKGHLNLRMFKKTSGNHSLQKLKSYCLKKCEALCGKLNFQTLEYCYIYEELKIA